METVKKIQHFFSYWYLRYLLVTEMYMVETWEKVVMHVLMGVLFVVFWYYNYTFVSYIYMKHHTAHKSALVFMNPNITM